MIPVACYRYLGSVYRLGERLKMRRIVREEGESRKLAARAPAVDVPPVALRFAVGGSTSAQQFLAAGVAGRRCIETALHRIGRRLHDFHSVLDFGCGCGRFLCAFDSRPADCRITGADIDQRAIGWCREHIRWADFDSVDALPPMPYRAGQFDLIWALSVFTHLDEQRQFRWLEELRRVLMPGGVLLVSLHGEHYWGGLHRKLVREMRSHGFRFARVNAYSHHKPDWYQATWHSPEYVKREWCRFFDVENYIPRGLMGSQDLVVLRSTTKPTEASKSRRAEQELMKERLEQAAVAD